MSQLVYGKNVVKQLIDDDKVIHEIIILEGLKDKDLIDLVKKKSIKMRFEQRKRMDAIADFGNHQGVIAEIDDYRVYSIEDIMHAVPEGKLPLVVMLDGIQDPHNLGAILRTCDGVGADGVIIGKHRSASLTPTVAKVSTGAIDTIKVSVVPNLVQTIKKFKDSGYWVVGADATNAKNYDQGTYDVPLLLVVGSEGFGISPLVRKNCDYAISLPMEGSVTSLNASVATGILMYEIKRQRK
ncbi:MAG: 23S rRNA (guanosine(2251)-2'-O)-methyltransferase RlmB [Erysipelotrichaceae bacterium]